MSIPLNNSGKTYDIFVFEEGCPPEKVVVQPGDGEVIGQLPEYVQGFIRELFKTGNPVGNHTVPEQPRYTAVAISERYQSMELKQAQDYSRKDGSPGIGFGDRK